MRSRSSRTGRRNSRKMKKVLARHRVPCSLAFDNSLSTSLLSLPKSAVWVCTHIFLITGCVFLLFRHYPALSRDWILLAAITTLESLRGESRVSKWEIGTRPKFDRWIEAPPICFQSEGSWLRQVRNRLHSAIACVHGTSQSEMGCYYWCHAGWSTKCKWPIHSYLE